MKCNNPAIEVTLLLFSGRPNPMWVLMGEQIDELREKINSLPETERKELQWLSLVVLNHHKVTNFPDQIVVHDGILDITQYETTNYYVDKSNIEEWLLHQGLETEYGQIIDEVLRRKEVAKIKQNKFPSKQDEACEPDGIQVRQKPEMEHL